MRSLQSRLGAGLAASLIVVFAAQWLAVGAAMRQLSEAGMVRNMEHDADNLLAGVSFDTAGRLRLDDTRVEQVFRAPFSGSYFRVDSGAVVQRSRSLWDQDLVLIRPAPGDVTRQRLRGPLGQPLLAITRTFTVQGRPVTIAVAEDLTPLERQLAQFRNRYALLTGALLAALLLLQALVVGTGLRPLRRMRADLQRLDRGEISTLPDRVPTELKPLVGELNHLLATLRARLTRSRQALGNLAHALKTPLTLLTDLADHARLRDRPEVREPLLRHTQAVRVLIERELGRARLAGAATAATRFDTDAEVPALLGMLQSMHRARPVKFETAIAPGLRLAIDREDMLELLGNLLDNACKWGCATVHLGLATEASTVRVEVEDDGPGCSAAECEQIAQRGVRLDENAPGHGLGLTIVRDIVATYGGRLEFDRSPRLGGLRVRVQLPVGVPPGSDREGSE